MRNATPRPRLWSAVSLDGYESLLIDFLTFRFQHDLIAKKALPRCWDHFQMPPFGPTNKSSFSGERKVTCSPCWQNPNREREASEEEGVGCIPTSHQCVLFTGSSMKVSAPSWALKTLTLAVTPDACRSHLLLSYTEHSSSFRPKLDIL